MTKTSGSGDLGSMQDEAVAKTDVGRVVIGAVRSLSLRVSVPLREGEHEVPSFHATARLSVRPETEIVVTSRAAREGDGELRLETAEVRFTNEVTIKNPASALSPTGGFLGGAIDWIKDALADVRIKKVYADTSGQVKVDGVVQKPWPLGESPVEDAIPKGMLPAIDLDIENMLFGASDTSSKPASPGAGPSLQSLLAAMGAIVEEGRVTIDLDTVPVPSARLGVVTRPLKIAWAPRPVTLRLTGKAAIGEDGTLSVTIARAATPSIGSLSVSGKLKLRSKKGVWSGDGTLKPKLDLGGLKLLFTPVRGVEIPLETLEHSALELDAKLKLEHGLLTLERGVTRLEVRASLDTGIDPRFSWRFFDHGLKLRGTMLSLQKGVVSVDASAEVGLRGTAIHLDRGKLRARLTAEDVDLRHRHVGALLGARIEAEIHCNDISIDHERRRGGSGDASFSLVPHEGKSFALPPIRREATFELGGEGAGLEVGSEGLAGVLAPALDLTGHGEEIVDPNAVAAGPSGSKALQESIAEKTGSHVREGNRVTLLVDGIESLPRRRDLIRKAKSSICLQTLIFKDDEVGTETADLLVEAAARKVAVRVIVDSLGNVERVVDLLHDKRVYETLRKGGVRLELYNDQLAKALRDIVKVLSEHPELQVGGGLDDLKHLKDAGRALGFFNQLFRIASGRAGAPDDVRDQVRAALVQLFGARRKGRGEKLALDDLVADGVLSASELLVAARQVADINHRWHEKYLIVDGSAAILGGMNIADEYLLGGNDKVVEVLGVRRLAWRDTDVLVEGPAAADAYRHFAANWATVTPDKEVMPPAPDVPAIGNALVDIIQHRPYNDGDHHIANFMIETLKALDKGQRAWIANAYFLPTGALRAYRDALIEAAKRGVDVRVVTNSATTSDLPSINEAALFPYRELLAAGVRIWERTGTRTMHTKAAVFGTTTVAIGSWNADNRSESLNSEALAVVYDPVIAADFEAVLERDRAPTVAREISLAEIRSTPLAKQADAILASIASDLL